MRHTPAARLAILCAARKAEGGLPDEPDIHSGRALLVLEGKRKGLSWPKAYKYALEEAEPMGKPWAAGKPRSMKRSYMKFKKRQKRRPKA